MVVYYQSKVVLEDDQLKELKTYEELLDALHTRTSLPKSNIKLISHGKLLSSTTFTTKHLESKIIIVGSTSSHDGLTQDAQIRVKDDLTNEGLRAIQSRERKFDDHDRRLRAKREVANPYRFHEIETLGGFQDEDRAREILESLASDPGILAVLKEHKWSVGKLCEMYPEGYVGVSDVCVLGLNKNKGQEIYLRLRTDDLKGFRKILTIKKVLYHELAHNEHSDHDDNFYMLMRQIEREVVDLDWRKSTKGHVLGGTVFHRNDLSLRNNLLSSDTETAVLVANHTALEVNHKSNIEEAFENEIGNRMDCIPKATKEVEKCALDVSQSYRTVNDVRLEASQMLEKQENICVNSCMHDNKSSELENSTSLLLNLVIDRIVAIQDETLASFYELEQEPPERILTMRQALIEMIKTVRRNLCDKDEEPHLLIIDQLLETMTLLRDILMRAKNSEDTKYRTVNRTKKLFRRVILETNALPVLYSAGFDEHGSGESHVKLVRFDPAILHMFVDILDKTVCAVKKTRDDHITSSGD